VGDTENHDRGSPLSRRPPGTRKERLGARAMPRSTIIRRLTSTGVERLSGRTAGPMPRARDIEFDQQSANITA